jgi:hypothetical protein
VGEANLVDGVLGDEAVETILGSLPVHSGTGALRPGKVTVLVRPEQIDIAQIGIAARNGVGVAGLAGRIVAYGYHGHDAVVHVIPDSAPAAPAIVVRTLGGCTLPAGSPVTLHARGPVLAWNQ